MNGSYTNAGLGRLELKRNNMCEGPKCERTQNVLETKTSVIGVQIAKQSSVELVRMARLLCGGVGTVH